MVGLTRGLISSVVKSLELVVRSLGIAAREAPAPVMATLLFGLIATTYFVSQVCPAAEKFEQNKFEILPAGESRRRFV